MASRNCDRDNRIYDDWIGGKSLRQLAKDYGLSAARIVDITHRIHFERENPNHIIVTLCRLHPELDPGMIRSSVNPVLRYFNNRDTLPYGKVHRATTEYFFNCLERLNFDDILGIDGIGKKKAEFLIKLKMGGMPTKVSM